MAYNLEKYRDKREKVLGVRKRGLSFGAISALVAAIIIFGLGAFAVPRTVAYFSTRNLDDAIYKMAGSGSWDQEIVKKIDGLPGVHNTVSDNHDTRLVVTFDRTETDPEKFEVIFGRSGVKAELLNRMSFRHRQTILKKEAAFEAP